MRAQGLKAFPKINPVTVLVADEDDVARSVIRLDGEGILPVSTLSNALSVYCNELGQYLIYQSDAFGFHNPKDVWEHEQIQIAIIGDSFGEGACVPSDMNLAATIREISITSSKSALTLPRISAEPSLGTVMRDKIFKSVLLPAPLRPMMPRTSPSLTSKDTQAADIEVWIPLVDVYTGI